MVLVARRAGVAGAASLGMVIVAVMGVAVVAVVVMSRVTMAMIVAVPGAIAAMQHPGADDIHAEAEHRDGDRRSATTARMLALAKPASSPSFPVPKAKRRSWAFLRANQ